MSVDEELRRELQARAASVKAEPDLDDLSRRIRARQSRTARWERMAVVGAVIVLAGSLGGLVGALLSAPHAIKPAISQTGGAESLGGASPSHHAPRPDRPRLQRGDASRTVFSDVLPGGISVTASARPLGSAVAVASAWGSFSYCASGQAVVSTIASGSSLGRGTGVTGMLPLGSSGLAVVSSGAIPTQSGEIWWVTLAAGSGIARIAAEGANGQIVAVRPSDGVAVVAGAGASGEDSVSAVAETGGGQSVASLMIVLGDGPRVVDAPSPGAVGALSQSAAGCRTMGLPAAASSAASSQPAVPLLAAASVVSAYTQAFSPDPWQGVASNLEAVAQSFSLGTGALEGAGGAGAGTTTVPSAGTAAHGAAASVSPPVVVKQVSFLSAGSADVVYRLPDGLWRVGSAVLADGGSWRVSLTTFCSAVQAGSEAFAPSSVVTACRASTSPHDGTKSRHHAS